MPGRGKPRNKSNGPLNKIGSTMKNDWSSVKRAYGDYGSGNYTVSEAFDRGMKRMGRGSYKKGLMKGGGYMAGGAMIFDYLFD